MEEEIFIQWFNRKNIEKEFLFSNPLVRTSSPKLTFIFVLYSF